MQRWLVGAEAVAAVPDHRRRHAMPGARKGACAPMMPLKNQPRCI